jgi:hypothetical protein
MICSLKVEAPGSSEVLVTTYQTACCHNPEDHCLNAYFEIAHAHTRRKPFYEGGDTVCCRLNKFTGFTVQLLVLVLSFLRERKIFISPSEYDSKNTFLSKKLCQ